MRREWGIGESQVLVLAVGRIARGKGVFELLDALSMAAARDSSVTAVLLGAMPGFDEREAVEAQLQKTPGLRDRVRILPACRPAEVWEYLCAADIFAFTSHKEGMPNSLLEAMSMGIPAVAFAIPAVKEIEGGTGGLVLVSPFDIERYAEAILRLVSDPLERTRIGELGRAQVTERFRIEKNMALALARLSELAGKPMARIAGIEEACARSGG